ncbi:MAG: redoxin domain-containing protein [Flavobacteriales bacterium]
MNDTPRCTAETFGFRDEYTAFIEAGAEVIGISMDALASHQAFEEKHRLPLMLLSDAKAGCPAL